MTSLKSGEYHKWSQRFWSEITAVLFWGSLLYRNSQCIFTASFLMKSKYTAHNIFDPEKYIKTVEWVERGCISTLTYSNAIKKIFSMFSVCSFIKIDHRNLSPVPLTAVNRCDCFVFCLSFFVCVEFARNSAYLFNRSMSHLNFFYYVFYYVVLSGFI